jgi:hypothetical protein
MDSITVKDDGVGMTLQRFTDGWMRIGTSAKEAKSVSEQYGRRITGEKGIGRFAVRFLGRMLRLESVADDPTRGRRTRLTAAFDWVDVDKHQDLGEVTVPYRLEAVDQTTPTGTTLTITALRSEVERLDLQKVRTGSLGVLSPLRSLFRQVVSASGLDEPARRDAGDPGFLLRFQQEDAGTSGDVAAAILGAFILRARLELTGDSVDLRIYRRGNSTPYLTFVDTYPNEVKALYADIRFLPRRKGAFVGLPVDGRFVSTWLARNSGVAVFDRTFRIQPYGLEGDDWLQLSADTARNTRTPRSAIANKHFPMSDQVHASTSENWMLRLPQSAQLVGLVQVEGRRTLDSDADEGLIASADREGFVENTAFYQLRDLVRGAVEAIAYADRRLQQEEEQTERETLLAIIRQETRSAIREVEANPNIATSDKTRIVAALAQSELLALQQDLIARERERQLEVMSLLGVVAGFMTHEFGVALHELEATHKELLSLSTQQPRFEPTVKTFENHINALSTYLRLPFCGVGSRGDDAHERSHGARVRR